ncbi:MAG: hypothetical protein KKG09_02215 [Verrucomicrobia bacterium]|nr:hypothetical protein [Verrucomicrobiota bacterium]MCG2681727.1 hypothetical protein [Kiritimatiellia bacterium]MBU4247665.1 hypothetical protein [Verrucomicrobiota bacterium]MBU4290486.1 hypothetical protein [Verrucomicrobiota bacterium]MBU4428194.1 hypothetical protein [Verrucomicrobiota bacterium]
MACPGLMLVDGSPEPHNGKGKQEYHFQYTYDPVRNRTRLQKQTFSRGTDLSRRSRQAKPDWWDHPSHSYAYDAANQLTEIGLGESAGKGKSWGDGWGSRLDNHFRTRGTKGL